MTEVIEDVVLKIESQDRMELGESRVGVLERKSEGEFDFEARYAPNGERQWLPKKVDIKHHIRITRHRTNGDWRILLAVNKDRAQSMNINEVLDLEGGLSDAITYIRNKQ